MTGKLSFASILLALVTAGALCAGPTQRSPERLEQLLKQLAELPSGSPEIATLRDKVDAEAGQRYAWASRLFWHTDLDQAQAAAMKAGKPILSLRMLGRLTDELSCANSRYFRTVLYANQQISKQLRDHYILHWSSERPVPVLTVDFGDGRVMKRTVTGNSIHYLLDASGQPLDAMPGLVGPEAFNRWLTLGRELAALGQRTPAPSRAELVRQIQQALQAEQAARWQRDLASLRRINPKIVEWTAAADPQRLDAQNIESQLKNAVPAETAVAVATTKRATEVRFIPLLTMSNQPVPPDIENNPDFWKALAKLHLTHVALDEASLALIAHQRPHAYETGDAAVKTMLTEFQKNLALDTVRNQYLLQRKLRHWLTEQPVDLASLNQRVYTELFLTPRQDPYLGLLPWDAYSGLENSGLLKPAPSQEGPAAKVSALNSPAGG